MFRLPIQRIVGLVAILAIALTVGRSTANEPDRLVDPISARIDGEIQAKVDAANISPAPRASDLKLLRRVTLDVLGRIPTRREIESFEGAPAATRYRELVERLIDSPEAAYHLRNELDMLLLAKEKRSDKWRDYLLWATRENRPWDQMFRDMMLPDPGHEPSQHAAEFLLHRAGQSEAMTNDTAVLFFGVNISCAQCHDHPLVWDWEQKHFYGMMSFFDRTYKTKKNTLAEKYGGTVKYKTVQGEEFEAPFMFLTGAVVEEPQIEKSDEQRKKEQEEVKRQMREQDAPPPASPDFSPREKLVSLALQQNETGQNLLARSIVNRTWSRLLGHGLVEPLDQMHSENFPSHPELLDWLAADFAAHGFDLRRLVRGIVLSEAYQRSSQWRSDQEFPPTDRFALAEVRPLSPWQLSLSLMLASKNPATLAKDDSSPADQRETWEKQAAGLTNLLDIPAENFQVGVEEALLFSNSQRVQNDYLATGDDRLVGYLSKLAEDKVVEEAFLICLTRRPTEAEKVHLTQYLESRADERVIAVQNVAWSLLSSPEFRFNH